MASGERNQKAISQLARNSNLHFGSTNNYSELVPNTQQIDNDGVAAAGPHPLHAQSNDMANKHIRYASNGLGQEGEILAL